MKSAFLPTQRRPRISTPPTPPPTLLPPTTPPHIPPPPTPTPATFQKRRSSPHSPQTSRRRETPVTCRPNTDTAGGVLVDDAAIQIICRPTAYSCNAQTWSSIILMWFYIQFNTLFKVSGRIWANALETRSRTVYVNRSKIRSEDTEEAWAMWPLCKSNVYLRWAERVRER